MKRIRIVSLIAAVVAAACLLGTCSETQDLFRKIEDAVNATTAVFEVDYDGNGSNGGIVPTDTNAYPAGAKVDVIGAGTMTLSGSTFVGWIDGDDNEYGVGSSFSMPASDITLYAMWTTNPTYTVTYDGNEPDGVILGGTLPEDTNNYEEDDWFTAKPNTLTGEGYSFEYWSTNDNGTGDIYTPLTSYQMGTENITLFAHWNINTWTVTFHSNNATTGSGPAAVQYSYGETVTVPAKGTLARFDSSAGIDVNCGFTGWCTDPGGNGTTYAYVEYGYGVDKFFNILTGSFPMPDYDVDLYANFGFFGGTDSYGNFILYDDADSDLDSSIKLYDVEARFLAIPPTTCFEQIDAENYSVQWGPRNNDIGGPTYNYIPPESYMFGDGKANTIEIVTALGDNGGTPYAAKICYDLAVNGYDDYFLPSREELELLHKVWKGMLFTDPLWTSTEYSKDSAETFDFEDATATTRDITSKEDICRYYPMTYLGSKWW